MRSFLLFLTAVLLSGCAGYKMGPLNGDPAGSRSVEIRQFINRTPEARLTEAVSLQLRKQLQRDGTYELETRGPGDIVMTGEIVEFDRSELAYQSSDVISPRDYTLTLRAQVRAVNQSTGKVIFDRLVSGRTTIRIGSDLGSAERQAVPLLAEDLARNAISELVDAPW